MANIFIAWELGAGLGHLSYLAPLTNALVNEGHTVTLAINDPSNIDRFNFPKSVNIIAAPSFRTFPQKSPQTVSLSCILINKGFQNPTILKGIVRCWHGLFSLTEPDLFIFDYAPTAMLAAHGMQCPKVIIGSGFSEPDPGKPGLVMLPDYNGAKVMAKRNETHIVKCVNQICSEQSLPSIEYLSDLYQHDLTLISTLPTLDIHQRSPAKSLYFNFEETQEKSKNIDWPTNDRKNIFAYLKVGNPSFLPTLEALSAIDANVICYCNRVTPELTAKYKQIHFSPIPLNIHTLLNKADAVVCHAGKGTISEALNYGVPLLLLPTHMEQNMNTIRIKELNLGLRGRVELGPKAILKDLSKLLYDSKITDHAAKFAKEYSKYRHKVVSKATVTSRICELLKRN